MTTHKMDANSGLQSLESNITSSIINVDPPKLSDSLDEYPQTRGRVDEFKQWCNSFPTEEREIGDILYTLVDQIRFIGPESTLLALKWLVSTAGISKRVLIDNAHKSGGYMLHLLEENGLLTEQPIVEEIHPYSLPVLRRATEERTDSDEYTFFDDASYNGTQLLEMLNAFTGLNGIPKSKIKICLVGITESAAQRLTKEGYENIFAYYKIPRVKDFITLDKAISVEKWINAHPECSGIGTSWYSGILSLFHHKVPDRFSRLFTEGNIILNNGRNIFVVSSMRGNNFFPPYYDQTKLPD